jgi:hypothetical protein
VPADEREPIARVSTGNQSGSLPRSPFPRLGPWLQVLAAVETFREGVIIISAIAGAGEAQAEFPQRSKSRGGM